MNEKTTILLSGLRIDKMYRIIVYCQREYEQQIKQAMWNAGAGRWGKYECYSFTTEGMSTWKPLQGAQPHIGAQDKLTEIKELRIETICGEECLQQVLDAIKKAHPYETPAIEVYKIEDIS